MRLILLIFSVLFAGTINGQTTESYKVTDRETTLFNYHLSVDSPEGILENLRENIRMLSPENPAIVLHSWKNVGTIKNQRQVKKVLKYNQKHYPPFGTVTTCGREDGKVTDGNIFFTYDPVTVKEFIKLNSGNNAMKGHSTEGMYLGDGVYELLFSIVGIPYCQRYLVDSKTCRVEPIAFSFFNDDVDIDLLDHIASSKEN